MRHGRILANSYLFLTSSLWHPTISGEIETVAPSKTNTSLLRRKHMKSTNIFASLMIIGAVVASGSAARAGEGGAAASVAAQLTGGIPTSISSSLATGKTSAAATARTTATDTYTSAFGTSGTLSLVNAAQATAAYAAGSDADLGTAQANQLTGGSITGTAVNLP
jgi:hypothetical protein